MSRQDLDRDESVEARIARAIHLAHPAGSDGVENLVRPEAHTSCELRQRARLSHALEVPLATRYGSPIELPWMR